MPPLSSDGVIVVQDLYEYVSECLPDLGSYEMRTVFVCSFCYFCSIKCSIHHYKSEKQLQNDKVTKEYKRGITLHAKEQSSSHSPQERLCLDSILLSEDMM